MVGRDRAGQGALRTPGDAEDAATYDTLWEKLRKAAADVQSHRHWKDCRDHGVEGADLVDVRQALKHATGAGPLDQGDIEKAA